MYICIFKLLCFPIGLFYVQPLTPIPITIRYSQPINLTFLVAASSDGIYNDIDPPPVFQYDPPGNPVGIHTLVRSFENSTQIFILDLDLARLNTSGHYIICMYANFLAECLLYSFNTVSPGGESNTTIGIIMVEGKFSYTISYIYISTLTRSIQYAPPPVMARK